MKKFLSLLLSFTMIISLLPVEFVRAEDDIPGSPDQSDQSGQTEQAPVFDSVTVPDIDLLAGFGGEWREHGVFLYDLSRNQSNTVIQLGFSDGTYETVMSNGTGYQQNSNGVKVYNTNFTYQGVDYRIEWDDPQTSDNVWTLGNTYTVDAHVGSVATTLTYHVVDGGIITDFSVDDMVIDENAGRWNYWSDEAWLEYDLYTILPNYQITMADGEVRHDYAEFFDPMWGTQWVSPHLEYEQDEQHPWTRGEYTVHAYLLGKEAEFTVTIAPGQIQEVQASYVTLYEGAWGTEHYDMNTDSFYYQYDLANNRYAGPVTFIDNEGTSTITDEWVGNRTGSNGNREFIEKRVVYQGTEYAISFLNPQNSGNIWTVGNTYTVPAKIGTLDTTVSFTVAEYDLIQSISVDPVYCKYEESGYWSPDQVWNEDLQDWDWRSIFLYNIEPGQITITLNDGQVITVGLMSLYEMVGAGYTLSSDQSSSNQWGLGEHTASLTLLGTTVSYPVYVVEELPEMPENPDDPGNPGNPGDNESSRIQSLEISPLTITEGTSGGLTYRELEDGSYEYYWNYDPLSSESAWITIAYKDGSVYSGTRQSIYEQTGDWIDYSSDQWDIHWGPGTHAFTIMLDGVSAVGQVEIQENGIAYISAPNVIYIENTNGYMMTDMDWETNTEHSFWYYNTTPNEVTIYFNDGTSYTGTGWQIYDTYGLSLESPFYQKWQNPMQVGNTYTVPVSVGGKICFIQVSIVESPIDHIEVDPLTIVEGTNGYTSIEYDENGMEHPYWRYNIYGPEMVRIYYKDGSVVSGNPWQITDQTGENVSYDEPYQSSSAPMVAGNVYYATVRFMGAMVDWPIEIVPNPQKIVDFEVEPLSFEEMTNGFWADYYDPTTGEVTHYAYWKYHLNNRVQFTFILGDGTRMTGSYDELYNQYWHLTGQWIKWEPEVSDDQTMDQPWGVGTHAFGVTVAGIQKTVPVEITEGNMKDVEVHSFAITQGTNGYIMGTGDRFCYYGTDLITVTFKDDSTFTGSYEEIAVRYPHALDTLSIGGIPEEFDSMGVHADGVHTITYYVLGQTKTYTMTIVPTDEIIDRIEAAPLTIEEYTYGSHCNSFMMRGNEFNAPYNYGFIPDNTPCVFIYDVRSLLELTIYFKDGSSVTGTMRDLEAKLHANLRYVDDQSIADPWGVGTHTAQIIFGGGKSFDIQFAITESQVESVSVEPLTVIGPAAQSMVMRIENFHVVFKDGTTYDGPMEGLNSSIQLEEFMWPEMPGDYTSTVWCMGQELSFNYTVVSNPVQWIDFGEPVMYPGMDASQITAIGTLHFDDESEQVVDIKNAMLRLYYKGIEYRVVMMIEDVDTTGWIPGETYNVPVHFMGDTYCMYVRYEAPEYTSLTISNEDGLTLTFGLSDGSTRVMHAVNWINEGRFLVTDVVTLPDVEITCNGVPYKRGVADFTNVQVTINGLTSNVLENCSWLLTNQMKYYLSMYYGTDMVHYDSGNDNALFEYHGEITDDIINEIVRLAAQIFLSERSREPDIENYITKDEVAEIIHRYFGDVTFDLDACDLFDAHGTYWYPGLGGIILIEAQEFYDNGYLYVNKYCADYINSFIFNADGTIAHLKKVDCSGRTIVTLPDGTQWYVIRGFIQRTFFGMVEEDGLRYIIDNGKVIDTLPGIVAINAEPVTVEAYSMGHYADREVNEDDQSAFAFLYDMDYLLLDADFRLTLSDGSEHTVHGMELKEEVGNWFDRFLGRELVVGQNHVTLPIGDHSVEVDINVLPSDIQSITADKIVLLNEAAEMGRYEISGAIILNVEYTDGHTYHARFEDFLRSRNSLYWGPVWANPEDTHAVIEIAGMTIEIPVEICDSPVASVKFEDITLWEGIDGYYTTNEDGDREFHYYFGSENVTESPIPMPTVYLKDGSLGEVVRTYWGYSLLYEGREYHILSFHELSNSMYTYYTRPETWKTGETHTYTGVFMGVRWSFRVKTAKSEFVKLQIENNDGLNLIFTRLDGTTETMKVLSCEAGHMVPGQAMHTLQTDKKVLQSVQIYIDGTPLEYPASIMEFERWINSDARIRVRVGNLMSNEIDKDFSLLPFDIIDSYIHGVLVGSSDYYEFNTVEMPDQSIVIADTDDMELMLKICGAANTWWLPVEREEAERRVYQWFGKTIDATKSRYYDPETDTILVSEVFYAVGPQNIDSFCKDGKWILSIPGIYIFLDQEGKIAAFDTMHDIPDGIVTLADGNDWYISLGRLQYNYTGYAQVNGEDYYIENGIVSEAPDTPVDPDDPENPENPENPEDPEEPETIINTVQGCSLTLNGDIGLNFYVHVSPELIGTNAYVSIRLPGKDDKMILLTDAPHSGDLYKFTVHMAAKEMADMVVLYLYDEEGNQQVLYKGESEYQEGYPFSVVQYLDLVERSDSVSDELKELARRMETYGSFAQQYFEYGIPAEFTFDDHWTAADMAQWQMIQNGSVDGISYYGSSLLLRNMTSIRHYFILEEPALVDDYTFTINGREVIPVQSGNRYYVEVADIAAQDLEEMPLIEVANAQGQQYSMNYSALTYVKTVLESNTSSIELKHLASALADYWQAAEAYFNK